MNLNSTIRGGIILTFDTIFMFFFIVTIPLIYPIRSINKFFFRSHPISVWTGAPIITMKKKCMVERRLGFNSFSIINSPYSIEDKFDIIIQNFSLRSRIIATILRYIFFYIICLTCTHVHSYCDGGLLPSKKERLYSFIELYCYNLLGIKLLVWVYGGDVRTKKISESVGYPNCCTDCINVGEACICNVNLGDKNYQRVKKFATAVFSMGDMIAYTPGSINDLFYWPIDLTDKIYSSNNINSSNSKNKRIIKIVHASNHGIFKGTRYLKEAVDQLKNSGYSIELQLISGIPNKELLKIFKQSDIIFDQCLIGFHGYTAIEAMALHKPVLSYIRREDSIICPKECPIVRTTISTLKNDLEYLIKNQEFLISLGESGRKYVEKFYSLSAFENRLRKVYKELELI